MKKIGVALASLMAVSSWCTALMLSVNVTSSEIQAPAPVKISMRQQKAVASSWAQRPNLPKVAVGRTLLKTSVSDGNLPQVLGDQTFNTSQLTQQQAIDLDKPGVVSIINWLDGNLSIPDFDIDLKTFALKPRPDLTSHSLKIDWNVYGSGFAVSSDGYIVTNAHVISKNSAYDQLTKDVSDHWDSLYSDEQSQLSDKDYLAYEHYLDATFGTGDASTQKIDQAINEQIAKYVKENMVDDSTQNIVVIDKSLEGQKLTPGAEIDEVYHKGLSAKIISFDPNFKNTGKDVALLQVSEKNIPALPLGSSDNLSSGQKTLILGYPSNAQISDADLFEPTLTEGVVGAIKDDSGQKIIQLDNKISPGSSGGPLLDAHGNVIGVTTYETGNNASGDNFGFALPIELAKDVIDKNNVSNNLGAYGTNFLLGVANQNNSVCKKALANFDAAKQTNSHFPVSQELGSYTQACQALITNGQSKDNAWDVIRIFYQQHQANAAILSVLILVFFAAAVFLIIRLFKHLRENSSGIPMVPSPPRIA